MRTPKSIIKADAKKNRVIDEKRSEKVIGDITILASQVLWGDNRTSRTICVYRTGAIREPWEDGYEEDIENYEFEDAGEANKKYMEIIRRYTK